MSQYTLFGSLVLLMSLVLVNGCGSGPDHIVLGGANAPGADGTLDVEEIDGGGTLVTVHMEHLPPPRHIKDELTTYIMWFEKKKGAPVKAGALTYNPEMRTADVMGTCPWNKFTVKITAERSVDVKKPSDLAIVEYKIPSE